jgi:hypothetical protein
MKFAVPVIVAAAVLLAAPAQSQNTGSLAADVLSDWQGQKAQLMGIADAMPADKFAYKATPAQRSYAEQILHIVQVNSFLLRSLGAKAAAPTINMDVTAKADVLRALEQSYDYGATVLREFNDATIGEPVDGPPFLGRSTRIRIAYFAMSHAMDIYGQMAVYLRLNDIVPPASRRGV